MREYQICTRCIMDTTDPEISFDENGVCNHCHNYDRMYDQLPHGKEKKEELKRIISKIKKDGRGRKYDCILGISGGVDSAYLAFLAQAFGLRVLAIHVDAGWNSEIAVNNIQKMCTKLDFDLHTIVIDWPTMRELQRAYMFSGLPNLDIPQDHVFVAATYQYAKKHKVKYILSGGNIATEGILPNTWGYSNMDYTCIKDVYRKCGRHRKSLKKYPHMGLFEYVQTTYLSSVAKVNLLNYIDYSKVKAIETLSREFGWQYYGGKHFESRFTKFFQSYYLPKKFGYDKKRAHLSSLIVGGEITRDEALKEMDDNSFYTEEEMLQDRDYILKKLDITLEEWQAIMQGPCRTENNYKNNKKLMITLRKIKQKMKSE